MDYRRLSFHLFARLVLLSLLWPLSSANAKPHTRIGNEIVVKLHQATDLASVAHDYGLNSTPLAQFGTSPIYRLQIISGASTAKVVAALKRDRRVVYAERNMLSTIAEDEGKVGWVWGEFDNSRSEPWALSAMHLPEAHKRTRGAGIRVAVLDTGVDRTHPDLKAHIRGGYDFVDRDSNPSEGAPSGAAYGHGTHVAGLVALAAPEATIMPLRVLDADGVGNIWVLAEALLYAADPDGNPATDDGADVINLSLRTPDQSRLLDEVIRQVTCESRKQCSGARGAVVVVAAGNNASSALAYPAAIPAVGVVSVAATSEGNTVAAFSNYGRWIDIAAPGEGVISTVPGGYAAGSGTSMAAPLVAGEAALLRALDPSLSPRQVAAGLIATAAPLNGIQGFGLADAAAALQP